MGRAARRKAERRGFVGVILPDGHRYLTAAELEARQPRHPLLEREVVTRGRPRWIAKLRDMPDKDILLVARL